MKPILPILFAALVASGHGAEPSRERADKLLSDAPVGSIHFVIDVPDHDSNEFYLQTDKILAVRVGSVKGSEGKASSVEIYTVAPGIEYSPQGEGKFLSGNQRFLLQFPTLEEARKAAASILSAIAQAKQTGR